MANSIRINHHFYSFNQAAEQLTLIAQHSPMELRVVEGHLVESKKVLIEKIWRVFCDLVLLLLSKITLGHVKNPIKANKIHLNALYEVVKQSATTINDGWNNFINLVNDYKDDGHKQITEVVGSLHEFSRWAEFSTLQRLALKFPAPYDNLNIPNAGHFERLLRWLGLSMTFPTPKEGLHLINFRIRKVAEAAHIHRPHPYADPAIEPWIARGDLGLLIDLHFGYAYPFSDDMIHVDHGYNVLLDEIIKRGPKERLAALISWALKDGFDFKVADLKECLEIQIKQYPDLILKDPEFALLVEKFRENKGLNPYQEEFEEEQQQIEVVVQ
jgi:hypothetical protein